ncbi:nucleotidyltransferase family protein [Pontibacter harenae]|uniref:nucleotidyltransferase family protein n=1 Tax=Pontibacter harenae TaxID=2894083 RepID=UPI001E63DAA3|nr:nucleotidyltransferase family protein [Pontibacter harenae]MCC9166585.1 nucleotidyltransferase family protein [Pontibacter harenae]
MKQEAIILAGGLGTRLQSVVKDVPKPMAEVAGRPFLDYILYFLSQHKVQKAVLAVGYKHEVVQDYYRNLNNTFGIELSYSIETELLGTGGAIFQAAEQIESDHCFVVNGDTFFDVNLNGLAAFAEEKSADIAIALKRVEHSQRYGHVLYSDSHQITSFKEKGEVTGAYNIINGGIYYMRKDLMHQFQMPKKFSFEVDFLQNQLHNMKAFGKEFEGQFIDIGVPEDYALAQSVLKDVIQ